MLHVVAIVRDNAMRLRAGEMCEFQSEQPSRQGSRIRDDEGTTFVAARQLRKRQAEFRSVFPVDR